VEDPTPPKGPPSIHGIPGFIDMGSL